MTAPAALTTTPPRVLLSLSGLAGQTVTVVRTDAQGNTAPVRSANPAPTVAGAWVGFDYEAPFNVPVTYTATTETGATVTTPTRTLFVASPWLIHPGIPELSRAVTVMEISDKTTSVNQGVHYPLGRSNPIVISDGVRRGSSFTVTMKTVSQYEAQSLNALLADASVLLLQVAYPFTGIGNYWWVSVGEVVTSTLSRDYGDSSRKWVLPCTITDAPVGLLQAVYTYADLQAEYPVYSDVKANFATYRDLVTDTPISG